MVGKNEVVPFILKPNLTETILQLSEWHQKKMMMRSLSRKGILTWLILVSAKERNSLLEKTREVFYLKFMQIQKEAVHFLDISIKRLITKSSNVLPKPTFPQEMDKHAKMKEEIMQENFPQPRRKRRKFCFLGFFQKCCWQPFCHFETTDLLCILWNLAPLHKKPL